MKIVVERKKCIGCGTCASLCPKFWEMGEDGRSNLKGSTMDKETEVQELETEELDCATDAAQSCPAQCISIVE